MTIWIFSWMFGLLLSLSYSSLGYIVTPCHNFVASAQQDITIFFLYVLLDVDVKLVPLGNSLAALLCIHFVPSLPLLCFASALLYYICWFQ